MAKETVKKGKLGQILRSIVLLVLVVVGLALVFNKPIRNYLIGLNTNKYQITKVSKEEIAENQTAQTTFDFASVESISAESILKAQMEAQHLPVIGGIAIPDVGLNLPIFKGVGNVELSYGAGTMKENQVMGGENNYALASHHVFGMTGSTDMLFSPLDRAKEGMKIYLTDKDKVYTYVITGVTVVTPEHVEVIDDTPGKSQVTLVTCTDAEATERTIVHGELEATTDFDKADQTILDAFDKTYNQMTL
ncbi:class A sortase [Streptococcus sp. zg-JUN1979]|uniref:class A sortase n=1 Tax=Streptococcus sp. zg-JUN1979 TaxID=3391450 RepID=UPI0039A56B76